MGGSNIGGGSNPWTHLHNTENKGYLRVEGMRPQPRAEFRYVTTVQQPQAEPLAGT